MRSHLTNPWIFISLCLALPITAFSIVKGYEYYFIKLPDYGKVQEDHLSGLTDHRMNTVSAPNHQDKVQIVNFFFTRCPGICVRMTNNMKKIQHAFAADTSLELISLSVDPENDDIKTLRRYVSKMDIDDTNWRFLTGNKSIIYTLARNDFKLTAASSGVGEFIHSDRIVLLDVKHHIRGYYDGTNINEIDHIISDINKCKHESSDFFTRR